MHEPTTTVPSRTKMALVAVLHKEQLGARIKKRREALGLTQKTLAELAHVKEGQTVSRWERGITEPEDLGAVARALQYGSVSELLKGIERMPEKDRRRLDPDGETQFDRIEAKLDRLLRHFDLDVDTVSEAVEAFETETDDEVDGQGGQAPPRSGRRAA